MCGFESPIGGLDADHESKHLWSESDCEPRLCPSVTFPVINPGAVK